MNQNPFRYFKTSPGWCQPNTNQSPASNFEALAQAARSSRHSRRAAGAGASAGAHLVVTSRTTAKDFGGPSLDLDIGNPSAVSKKLNGPASEGSRLDSALAGSCAPFSSGSDAFAVDAGKEAGGAVTGSINVTDGCGGSGG